MGNPGLIVLDAAAPIPPGTPAGTVVLRTTAGIVLGDRDQVHPMPADADTEAP